MSYINSFNKLSKVFSYVILSIVLFANTIIILQRSSFEPTYMIYYTKFSTTSIECHNVKEHNDFPEIGKESPPEKSIHFLETSCKGGLNSREACSIESAARRNRNWQINVFFAGPAKEIFLKGSLITKLKQLNNTNFYRIHPRKLAETTPIQTLLKSGVLENNTSWPIQHSSDVLRFLILFKFGGVYLDLDIILVKALDSLPSNWVGKESAENLGAGAMAISMDWVGRYVAKESMRILTTKFNPNGWRSNGVDVITQALRKICSTPVVKDMTAEKCQGFLPLKPKYFYPIWYRRFQKYFRTSELDLDEEYGHHFWNYITHNIKIKKNSFIAKLARKYCPSVYELYGEDFGS